MQATLLSLAIAIILALVAALVGPYFVDWSQYRTSFEAEASRLTGMPVRVGGHIVARLLPTPSLVLKEVELGAKGTPQVRAHELSVEFALGPLLRGNWRASEVRLLTPQIHVGLDQTGAIDWPEMSAGLDPDRLSIDRFAVEEGRLVLSDAASGGRLVLDRVSFAGEFRSLLGPAKGEGSFETEGTTYRYALGAGRLEDDALKLRIEIAPGDRPWTADADGVVHFAKAAPEFDGAVKLVRAAPPGNTAREGAGRVPWQANGHVKANHTEAVFDKAEFQYGPDDRAVRLTGAASLRFGKNARYDAVLSGRQLDLDALARLPEPTANLPLAAVQELARLFSGPLKMPIPGRVGVGIESVMFAGSPLRDVRVDLTSNAGGWDLEHFEFRGPGLTSARGSGRVGSGDDGVAFRGPISIEAGDPKALWSWLQGRSGAAHGGAGLLRASGELTLGSDRVAVDGLKAELDRKIFGGRMVYAYPADHRPARLELDLKAAELDLDELVGAAPAILAGAKAEVPGDLMLSANVDRVIFAGVPARNASIKLTYDGTDLTVDHVSSDDLGGASVKLSGRLRSVLSSPRGSLALDLKAGRLDGLAAIASKLSPIFRQPLLADLIGRLSPLDLHAGLSVEGPDKAEPVSKLAIDGTAGSTRIHLVSEADGRPLDTEKLALKLDGKLTADDGSQLVALLGLAQWLHVEKGTGSARLTLDGRLSTGLGVDAQVSATGLTARAQGTAHWSEQGGSTAGLDLSVAASDVAPLWAHGVWGKKLPANLKSRLTVSTEKLTFDEITGSVLGSPVRGRLGIELASVRRIDGQIEMEEIAVPSILASAMGLPGQALAKDGLASQATFEAGWFGKLVGRVEFGASRAIFAPGFTSRAIHGSVRLDSGEIAFDNVESTLGEGRVRGNLVLRRNGDTQAPGALGAHTRIALDHVDVAAILPGPAAPGVNGRLTLQVEADGSGHSPATLLGSLKGTGTVSIEDARLAALDPAAFEAAIRAADRGTPINAAKIGEVVGPALAQGELPIARADGALTIAGGQARVSNMIAHGDRADLSVSGVLDLASRTVDARLALSGPADGGAAGTARPDLFVALRGPALSPKRTVDVAAFVNWLMLRALDRETRRMESLEGEKHEAPAPPPGPGAGASVMGRTDPEPAPAAVPRVAVPGAPSPTPTRPSAPTSPKPRVPEVALPSQEAPSLAPPIEIRPAPGATAARPQRPKEGAASTRSLVREPPQSRSLFERLFGPHN